MKIWQQCSHMAAPHWSCVVVPTGNAPSDHFCSHWCLVCTTLPPQASACAIPDDMLNLNLGLYQSIFSSATPLQPFAFSYGLCYCNHCRQLLRRWLSASHRVNVSLHSMLEHTSASFQLCFLFFNPMDALNHVTNHGSLSAGFWEDQSQVVDKVQRVRAVQHVLYV